MVVYVERLVLVRSVCSRNHIIATRTTVIRSVDLPSTVFLTALVNIELNSLLRKPLVTSDNIFIGLHSSWGKATTMSWKLWNLASDDIIYLIHSNKKLAYNILILSEVSLTIVVGDLLCWNEDGIGQPGCYTLCQVLQHCQDCFSLFSSLCLEK